jgi:TetR/AcrR family transcriptional repressor of nem operon
MARPRTFDTDEVLDRALETFWDQGYEATSVQDLVEATDVRRASLYNAFGGKHDLYLEALRRYEERWVGRLQETLGRAADPRQGIRAVLEAVADEAGECPQRGSCMLTNAATELGHRDPDTAERVAGHFRRLKSTFADALRRGQDEGVVDADTDVEATACFLLNTVQGLRVLAKTCPARADLQNVVDVAMKSV